MRKTSLSTKTGKDKKKKLNLKYLTNSIIYKKMSSFRYKI